MSGWIAVDLDGTLAFYDKWRGSEHIGDPIPKMLGKVKMWLAQGKDVRIFTARIAVDPNGHGKKLIEEWCLLHVGKVIPVTNMKDYGMYELWDDRCVQVTPNTGERVDGN
jgi:hypothetical protein